MKSLFVHLFFILALLFSALGISQNIPSVRANVTTSSIWRGIEYAQTPVVNATVAFGITNLELSFNGTMSLADNHLNDGITTTLAYTYGSAKVMINDYYCYNYGLAFNNFKSYDAPGAHLVEVQAAYTYKSLDATAAVNVYNDKANTVYLELGWTCPLDGARFFIGATPGNANGDGPFYYTYNATKFTYTNAGFTVIGPKLGGLPTFGTFVYSNVTKAAYVSLQINLF